MDEEEEEIANADCIVSSSISFDGLINNLSHRFVALDLSLNHIILFVL